MFKSICFFIIFLCISDAYAKGVHITPSVRSYSRPYISRSSRPNSSRSMISNRSYSHKKSLTKSNYIHHSPTFFSTHNFWFYKWMFSHNKHRSQSNTPWQSYWNKKKEE